MPFTNLSAEVDEYFADGLTEDIITNLARFRDLRVIAGASTLQIQGPCPPAPGDLRTAEGRVHRARQRQACGGTRAHLGAAH